MMKISVAFLAVMSLAVVGCRNSKAGDPVAKLTEIKGKMCACTDKTCSDKVSGELVQWGEEHFAGDKPVSLGESDSKKVETLKEEIAKCLLKLEVPHGDGAPGATGAAGRPGEAGEAAPAMGSAAAGSAH